MEETILTFKDVVLIISGMDSIIIIAEDAYLLDGDYHEKIQVDDIN